MLHSSFISSEFRRRLHRAALVFFAASALLTASRGAPAIPVGDVYPNRVEPSIIESLKKGPNAQVYGYRQVIAMMKSDVPVNAVTYSTVNARVLVYGRYNSPRGVVDLELRGNIRDGLLEIDFPLGRVDAVLFDWEETAARPDELKTLKPSIRSLTFRETTGFRAIYLIQRTFAYQLTVDIPYNPLTKNLMPAQPKFGDIAEFVKALESREHARAILDGNDTGLPAFITTEEKDVNVLVAGYLLNAVKWNVHDDRWEYTYDDDLRSVRNFPEIKQLLKSPDVKAFVEAGGETRVKAFGGDKTGYSFVLVKEGGTRRMEATLLGRRVLIKPAPTPVGFSPGR